jgi:hypothetical protein
VAHRPAGGSHDYMVLLIVVACAAAIELVSARTLMAQTTPSPTGTPTPTATSAVTPSQTPTASPTNPTTASPTPQRAPRAISLATSKRETVARSRVSFTGEIVSTEPSCEDDELVTLRRRPFGSRSFRIVRSTFTGATGEFEIRGQVNSTSDFLVVTSLKDTCDQATSDPDTVLVRVRLTASASDNPVEQGGFFSISGSVRPHHEGTRVTLKRKQGNRFHRIDLQRLRRQPTYRFFLVAGWEGTRTFRVKWAKQHRDHEANRKTLHIRTI